MKKLIYAMFLVAGICFANSNVSIAQDTKTKAACCNKAQASKTDTKTSCPMIAEKSKADCEKKCPMAAKKDCPMAETKNCPKANCPMKSGAVAGKKSKSGPVAEAKLK